MRDANCHGFNGSGWGTALHASRHAGRIRDMPAGNAHDITDTAGVHRQLQKLGVLDLAPLRPRIIGVEPIDYLASVEAALKSKWGEFEIEELEDYPVGGVDGTEILRGPSRYFKV